MDTYGFYRGLTSNEGRLTADSLTAGKRMRVDGETAEAQAEECSSRRRELRGINIHTRCFAQTSAASSHEFGMSQRATLARNK